MQGRSICRALWDYYKISGHIEGCEILSEEVREALRKKIRKIYDIVLKGGWVANSKHDFFSIKNYDIIIGRVGDRLPCHNFQIIIFS